MWPPTLAGLGQQRHVCLRLGISQTHAGCRVRSAMLLVGCFQANSGLELRRLARCVSAQNDVDIATASGVASLNNSLGVPS